MSLGEILWFSHILSQPCLIHRLLELERGQDWKGHFTDLLINPFNKYLPITYHEPDTAVGAGE